MLRKAVISPFLISDPRTLRYDLLKDRIDQADQLVFKDQEQRDHDHEDQHQLDHRDAGQASSRTPSLLTLS